MRKFRFPILAVAPLFLYTMTLAEMNACGPTSSLSESWVRDEVSQRFPGLDVLKATVQVSEAEVDAARGQFDLTLRGELDREVGTYSNRQFDFSLNKPTSLFGLNLQGGFRNSDGDYPVYDGKYKTGRDGEWRLGLELPLLRGFLTDSRRAGLNQAQARLESQVSRIKFSELEFLRNALHRYYDVRAAAYRVQIQKDLLAIAEFRQNFLKTRVRVGEIMKFEADDNQRLILQRQVAIELAEQNLLQAHQDLAFFVSCQPNTHHVTEEQLEAFQNLAITLPETVTSNTETLVNGALAQRQDLLAVSKDLVENDEEVRLTENRLLPKLDLKTSVARDLGPASTGTNIQNWNAMLSLEVPIERFSLTGPRDLARFRRIRIEANQELLRRRIETEVRSLKAALDRSRTRVTLSEEEYRLAKKLEEGEKQRFKFGDSAILLINLREQTTAEARVRAVDTKIELIKTILALQVALGQIPQKYRD